MKQMSKVFTFVPSYNHAPFIERCLKSIIKQTFQPTKLLVIDDGSKDESPKIIERILKDCPFDSELIVRENRGLCATLNEGFERSFGDYFAYIGSDDIWLPTFIEKRVKLLNKRDDALLAYGNGFLIDENGDITDCSADWSSYPDGDVRDMLLEGIAPISSTVFYRRSALENERWNSDSRLEDYELYLKLSTRGKFAFDSEILSCWRQHSYNVSKDMPLMLSEVIEAQNRNVEKLGLDANELQKWQTRVKFRFARDFLQNGYKKAAMQTARGNFSGANSFGEVVRFSMRMAVPFGIVRLRRKFLKQEMKKRFGKIEAEMNEQLFK
jgi:alpha-1,3-rhamnosyltransferase